jgi:hypothetical protein
MMHHNRCFKVQSVATTTELANKLTQYTWTLCSAFELRVGGQCLTFYNDSTSEDGAQEYAVYRQGVGFSVQIESITFGWCSEARALELIERLFAQGAGADLRLSGTSPRCDHSDGTCRYCA